MKKVLALMLTASMLFALAGCELGGGKSKKSSVDEDEVVAMAENFAGAIQGKKSKSMAKLCGDDEDWTEMFEQITESSEVDGDTKDAHQAILDTLAYEVDEDSVETSKKGATVEINFTVKNYEKVDVDICEDIDDFIDELDDQKDKEITVELELELDDDELIISNCEDALKDLYVWEDYEVEFYSFAVVETTTTEETVETTTTAAASNDYADAIADSYFFCEGSEYFTGETVSDVVMVAFCVEIDDSASGLNWTNDVSAELYYNGQFVYADTVQLTERNGYWTVYSRTNCIAFDPMLQDPETGYMMTGLYEYYLVDNNGDEIAYDYFYAESYDRGYDFSVTWGDCYDTDMVAFVDWYIVADNAIEFDLYMTNPDYDLTYIYEVYEDGKLIFTSEEMTEMGSFIDLWATPADCNLSAFKGSTYEIACYDSNGDLIVSSAVIHN